MSDWYCNCEEIGLEGDCFGCRIKVAGGTLGMDYLLRHATAYLARKGTEHE